jgi:hypothetical protein
MFTQLHEILYTDSQDMLVLSSNIASRYYNYCTDDSTSPGNYGYAVSASYITHKISGPHSIWCIKWLHLRSLHRCHVFLMIVQN